MKDNITLYEAIELRAEMEARIKTMELLRPEREERGIFRGSDTEVQPASGFDLVSIEAQIENLKTLRRKINAVIQEANHKTRVGADGQTFSLAEALELRKETNENIGRLSTELRNAAWLRVIHKEERDVVRSPSRSFELVMKLLEEHRIRFRSLVGAIHDANHQTRINFYEK